MSTLEVFFPSDQEGGGQVGLEGSFELVEMADGMYPVIHTNFDWPFLSTSDSLPANRRTIVIDPRASVTRGGVEAYSPETSPDLPRWAKQWLGTTAGKSWTRFWSDFNATVSTDNG
jgi:hypothetical protein